MIFLAQTSRLAPAGTRTVNDGFNESEVAYTLEFDPVNGLTFDMDGSGTTRYAPFMKIRQWRSLQDPAVALETVTLANDVDYRADVKPVARRALCQRFDLALHT